MSEFEGVRAEVHDLLSSDMSGHSIDHVDRVYRLAVTLAEAENADMDTVKLAALLHDVDDYKLFGRENAEQLTNAREIMDRHAVDQKMAQHVLKIISSMGYNTFLEGRRPDTIEGQVISDADMCDAIGSQGLLRVFEYNRSKGKPFFISGIPPVSSEVSAEAYRAGGNDHAVQHFFDKLLKIPTILMTESGRAEGYQRAAIMEDFLRELFREEGADDWQQYLEAFTRQGR